MKQIKNKASDRLMTVINTALAKINLFWIAPLNRLAAGSSAVADSSIHNNGMMTDFTRDTDLELKQLFQLAINGQIIFTLTENFYDPGH